MSEHVCMMIDEFSLIDDVRKQVVHLGDSVMFLWHDEEGFPYVQTVKY